MNFNLSADQYTRACIIGEKLGHLLLRYNNGNLILIATNYHIASFELIGANSDQKDGDFLISIDEQLLATAKQERQYNGQIAITFVPELKFASAKTTYGFSPANNIGVFNVDYSKLSIVNTRAPFEMPKKTTSPIMFKSDHFLKLASAAPSGKIVLQQYIEHSCNVVVRDVENPNWVGLFVSTPNEKYDAATLPNWFQTDNVPSKENEQ